MYLVTGGAGFIGHHTVRALRAEGHPVRVLDDLSTGDRSRLEGLGVELLVGSITDGPAVAEAMRGVERVIHLAAKVSVPDSWARPAVYDHTNVHGFVQVLAAAKAAGVAQVAYASSCAVYGSLPGLPKAEDAPLQPESPYAATKAANESYAAAWSAAGGLDVVGLRYFNVFGPGQDPSGPYGAVIPTFVELALAGRTLTIHGDGEQGRDFVPVSEVVRANLAAVRTPGVGGRVFNVGAGRMLTINQLADAVAAVLGRPVAREHGPARQGDVRFSRADVQAAAEALDWRAEADFEAALDETVRWFVDGAGPPGR